MMVLNCGIGLLTPPVGAVLFIGSAIANKTDKNCRMENVVKATLPFYFCMIIALLLITFVPWFTMVLPNALMPA
jgi:TRAP-type C4-dicarboxylate transport system permease large subunit